MKKFLFVLFMTFTASSAHAWSDAPILLKILANAVQQLTQLQQIMNNGKQNLQLLRDVHSGINNALEIINTTFPNSGSEIYKDWQDVGKALEKFEKIYGVIENAPNAEVLRNLDRTLTEAFVLNSNTYKYTERIDLAGENIKSYSQTVSPKGAARLTAQSLGIILQTLNQSLRTQSATLKIEAQKIADENRREKAAATFKAKTSHEYKETLQNKDLKFEIPRF